MSLYYVNKYLDEIIDFIKENYDPENVFEEDVLSLWATNNGFIKE